MSWAGDGIPGIEEHPVVLQLPGSTLNFVPRRFHVGGGLAIQDGPSSRQTPVISCVLCGRIIGQSPSNLEHPFPQWLHRFSGDVGERRTSGFGKASDTLPTWRQLSLKAHTSCNQSFGRYIETPAKNAIQTMVNGGVVTSAQVDCVLDWLDKIRTTSAHMAVALSGHMNALEYGEHHFPHRRIGLFDRSAAFFRVSEYREPLNLFSPDDIGFQSTPTSLCIRIKDLMIVTSSNNYMLSTAFGLNNVVNYNGSPQLVHGSGIFTAGYGNRDTRLGMALIVAQPMRRQHMSQGFEQKRPALSEKGDGHIYHLAGTRWTRTKSLDFGRLSKVHFLLADQLAGLEAVEQIILCKEMDFARAGRPKRFVAMDSMNDLIMAKSRFIENIGNLRRGLYPQWGDRPQ